MLYLSLIIILLGVMVLLYSISVEVRKNSDRRLSPGGDAGHGFIRGSDSGGDVRPAGFPAADSGPVTAQDRIREQAGGAENAADARAVLYEDASGLIDYQLSTGTIDLDPEMTAYKKINRIGEGSLVYEKHGMSFYMQNRLYRFDFHRIEDFAMGDNYIAVRLKGAQSTKLIIVENNRRIIAGIGDNYRSYLR